MRVSGSGCFPLAKHTEIISAFPYPTDKKGLQRVLGIRNFYRRFIMSTDGLLHPLNEALKGKPRALTWNLEMNQSFAAVKSVLANVPTLVQPDPSARIFLSVDASSSHVRTVLQQEVAGSWAPLAFYSKKLIASETRYSAFVYEFLLFTDHKPLTFALFRTSPPWSAMQQRRLSFLSEFNCEIYHLPGSENVVADALSRPEPNTVPQHLPSTTPTTLYLPPPPAVPGVSLSKMVLLQ